MASKVEICNRALQKLGAKRIVSLDDDSVTARACNVAFEPVKLAELRDHSWNFAVKRVSLAANATAPEFGPQNSFPLPSDFVRLLPPDAQLSLDELDWLIEGRNIFTNDSAPLQIRYVSDVTDPNIMDSLFREALSSRLALELCEQLTQSNTKKADIKAEYKENIGEARRTNAIEKPAVMPPDDSWITVRR